MRTGSRSENQMMLRRLRSSGLTVILTTPGSSRAARERKIEGRVASKVARKLGSAQESDEGCILGGFLENTASALREGRILDFVEKWAEFADLLWKWRVEGGLEE